MEKTITETKSITYKQSDSKPYGLTELSILNDNDVNVHIHLNGSTFEGGLHTTDKDFLFYVYDFLTGVFQDKDFNLQHSPKEGK